MISVCITVNALGLTDESLTKLCDAFADLDLVCNDLGDWSVGADLGKSEFDFEVTLLSDDADMTKAVERANELLWLGVKMSGGDFAAGTHAERVAAELIDA